MANIAGVESQRGAAVAELNKGFCAPVICEGDCSEMEFTQSYYRPFVYGTQPKIQQWGKRFILLSGLSRNRWFKRFFNN